MKEDENPIYYLIRFHESLTHDSGDYIIKALRDDAGLILHGTRSKGKDGGLILHVSAENSHLHRLADYDLELKKLDRNGIRREYRVDDPDFDHENILTISDKQICVLYAMESLHFDKSVKYLPGMKDDKIKILKGSSILSAYRETGLIETFPVHNDQHLEALYRDWKLMDPPISKIQNYFGANVALYFSFMSFYTAFLIPISAFGILQFILDKLFRVDYLHSNILFALINLISVTVFLELWKRRSNEHGYLWGTSGKLRHKRPRPEFRGELGINPVTGKDEIQYPIGKTLQKCIFVSFPITFLCLLLAFLLMLGSFEGERLVIESFEPDDPLGMILAYVPSILYSILGMQLFT